MVNEGVPMKYMIMMFGSAAEMIDTKTPDWIQGMVQFMGELDQDLRARGELVFNAGLADGSTAKVVRLSEGRAVTSDGPFAESKESLIGYWVVDVDSEERAIEICSRIAHWSGAVELRRLGDAPPEL
jgi:hypothetical protein